jgi:hypothetical protein
MRAPPNADFCRILSMVFSAGGPPPCRELVIELEIRGELNNLSPTASNQRRWRELFMSAPSRNAVRGCASSSWCPQCAQIETHFPRSARLIPPSWAVPSFAIRTVHMARAVTIRFA